MTNPGSAPPATPRETVVDYLYGEAISDPYRWLEDDAISTTRNWIAGQTRYARDVLDSIPGRDRIAAQVRRLLSIGDISLPVPRAGRYFFERREGLQNQAVLFVRDGDAEERSLIDPNAINSAGTTALDWWYPSEDGRLLAYGLSESGDERSMLYILDVASGGSLPDQISNTRAASVAWLPDSSGFYYTRYPAAGDVPAGDENYYRRVYLHKLGTDPVGDALVFGDDGDPTDWPSVSLSPDGRYLFITVNKGWDRSDCYLRMEGAGQEPFAAVIEGAPALSSGQVLGDTLYLLTNLGAPRYRLFAIDPRHLARERWRELIPEHPIAVLEDVHVARSDLVLTYLEDATSRLELRDMSGKRPRDVPLPGIGSVAGVSGEWNSDEAFFAFTSFTVPPMIRRCICSTADSTTWATIVAPEGSNTFEVRQVWYPSKDGTQISMFIIARHGLPLDSSNPTVISGYGGFNISMTPTFSRTLAFWLERGGVYAVPNLRGGGEYGESWHAAGMLANKQNVFDDFIAGAEYLYAAGYTSPGMLACSGGSNGGLLVGAAITQRPDLFRAAICAVPLLDMLRYHQFQIARLWIAEYGSAENREQFEWLRRYSPYHQVTDGVEYPAVLFLSGESDSRVDPMHARKMTARLQNASGSGLPVLLRVEAEAGHGAGRPLDKTLAEQTDVWSFLCWQLGVST
jgi:prolyl oligopeptidase